jgi:hypothetical protein
MKIPSLIFFLVFGLILSLDATATAGRFMPGSPVSQNDPWSDDVEHRIRNSLNSVAWQQLAGKKISCTFSLDSDGLVTNAKIIHASGSTETDDLVLATLKKSEPYLPSEPDLGSLPYQIDFCYKIICLGVAVPSTLLSDVTGGEPGYTDIVVKPLSPAHIKYETVVDGCCFSNFRAVHELPPYSLFCRELNKAWNLESQKHNDGDTQISCIFKLVDQKCTDFSVSKTSGWLQVDEAALKLVRQVCDSPAFAGERTMPAGMHYKVDFFNSPVPHVRAKATYGENID